jgi:HlyD family secretion protein
MVNRLRLIVPIAAVALFFLGGWTLRNKLAADRQGEWVEIKRSDLVTGIEVTGTLSAIDSDLLGPPQIPDVWDFKISMMAPEGSDVKLGEPVLAFDTTELQHRLDENRALAEQARKEIEKTRGDVALRGDDDRLELAEAEGRLRRGETKLVAPPGVVPLKERREVELDYGVAKREVAEIGLRIKQTQRAAEAQIRLLQSKQAVAESIVARTEDAIRRMTVTAPRDGTVVYVTNWRGDKFKIGDTCWKALRVMEIPDLTRMKADGEVDEADAGSVAVGQRVSLRLDARPDEQLSGIITRAGRTVQQQTGTKDPIKVLKVLISVERTDPATMRPGMRFQGTVELARIRDALLVPRSAVIVAPGGAVVYRRDLFAVHAVPVKLGGENDKFAEVLSGLSGGDRILLSTRADKEGGKS